MSSLPEDPDAPAGELEDPVDYFLTDLEYHGRTERTRAAYERVLDRFASFLEAEYDVTEIENTTHRQCLAWIHALRNQSSESTIATYASYLNRFFDYMVQIDAFDGNPMTLVMEEMDETVDTDPSRRDISVGEMRLFVRSIDHPLDHAVVVTLLKTGLRVGELCNLDLRDLTLEDCGSYDLGTRARLDGHDRTLFVDANISKGDVVAGEDRTASNKRKRSTLVPIDAELAHVLRHWLAIRPDSYSDAAPLFVSTRDEWGARLTPEMVRSLLECYTRDVGWYRTGGGAEENVTPHYFRHFFTTHLRDRTGDRGVVKYIRGDVADDVIDTYTHNWGDRVRDVYEANIYSLR